MGKPDIPAQPAEKPERVIEIEPEEIELGGQEVEGTELRTKGKRALTKPTGGPVSGLNV